MCSQETVHFSMRSPSPTCVLLSRSATLAVLSTSFSRTRAATPCRPPTNCTDSTPPNSAKMSRTCLSVQLAGNPRTRMQGAGASPSPALPSSSRFLFFPFSFSLSFCLSLSLPRSLSFSLCLSLPFSFSAALWPCSPAPSARLSSSARAAGLAAFCAASGPVPAANAAVSCARRAGETSPVSSRSHAKRRGPRWKPSNPNAGRPSQPSPTMVSEGHRVLVRSSSRRPTRVPSASKPRAPLAPARTRSERDQRASTSPPSSSTGWAAIMAAASECSVKLT
mmetsp:Transcript_31571/g.74899  ORF Transcript_31571/g.74899 Transcript_31571/m.74899 type:complete len:279 (-) Transcript_31571:252-1088(-)